MTAASLIDVDHYERARSGPPAGLDAPDARHGPREPAAATGDQCDFSRLRHGYRLTVRMPCSW